MLSCSSTLYTKFFLTNGAPWNAVCKKNMCAGNYASDGGHQEVVNIIVDHATKCEMLLSQAILNNDKKNIVPSVVDTKEETDVSAQKCTKDEYLSRSVRYEGDNLLDGDNDAVMMEWERPLMAEHAKIICQGKKRVLNVGFGMGIIDSILQTHEPTHHTIIEAHPDVYAKMKKDGWCDKPNVTVLFGRWQDVIGKVTANSLDGAFFDTYAENHTDLTEFHQHLPRILAPGGVYSFFNGLCPDNIFFHGVACQVIKLELESLDFEVEFAGCEIQVKDEAWEGVRRKYWHFDFYYIPICVLKSRGGEGEEEGQGAGKKQRIE
ncbi:hypothetical protein TrRE_jg6542 [Triparma retinervis]|uniref:RMT2 domain-containing protein n=1 Tax=Triparma retinervis TaxID=2557542 RepID=A0A9W6ZHK6_9STRA|nr:hypothetical protein TrRE_jg6542 [Triparma retinervis]